MSVIVLSQRQAARAARTTSFAVPRFPLKTVAFLASTVFFLVLADAFLNSRAFYDTWVLDQFVAINSPVAEAIFVPVNALTSSNGAVAAWAITLVVFLTMRWWLAAIAVVALPIGGILNEAVGIVVGRERPSATEFARAADTAAHSFPSGHVMGAVMLYGLLFVVAGRIRNAYVRNGVRAASVGIILLVGPARLWEGAHWPSDVIGAYSLGALVLAGVLAVYLVAERSWGHLPLVKRGEVPHDENIPHAHALTSVVVFNGDTVSKIYSPGLLPRMLYWISFQAPFPYIENRKALEAAVARRNLAGMLTQYWYGSQRVARATGIDTINGRLALSGEFVDGKPASDKLAAKSWLKDLRTRFEASGLPTWQIDPRQPRAADNVLETADGSFMVVDLESGLVAPIASPKVWLRGIRRGAVPMFDDVDTARTRQYIAGEAASMRDSMGATWVAELVETLDEAETTQAAWRAGEPRLIGRFVGGFWSGWNYKAWPERLNKVTARGQEKADRVLNGAVERWHEEGRLSAGETAQLKAQIASAEMKQMMPHLGAHGVITLFLRFPFGSIARPAWTLSALTFDTGRLFTRHISMGQWKQSWTLHSPVVMVLSAIPGFGAFAYLAARPVRRNRLLVRAVFDTLALKVPGNMYERTGVRRVIARQPGGSCAAPRPMPYIGQEWQIDGPALRRAA